MLLVGGVLMTSESRLMTGGGALTIDGGVLMTSGGVLGITIGFSRDPSLTSLTFSTVIGGVRRDGAEQDGAG
jgi:hypothetical protein